MQYAVWIQKHLPLWTSSVSVWIPTMGIHLSVSIHTCVADTLLFFVEVRFLSLQRNQVNAHILNNHKNNNHICFIRVHGRKKEEERRGEERRGEERRGGGGKHGLLSGRWPPSDSISMPVLCRGAQTVMRQDQGYRWRCWWWWKRRRLYVLDVWVMLLWLLVLLMT